MTVKELKDILNGYGEKYDNCEIACYETSGALGFANTVTNAYIGKTYVNQGHPVRRMLQIQFDIPDKMRDYIRENCPSL